MQIVALAWAWVAIYRLWMARWRTTPVFPALARVMRWTGGAWRRVVRWVRRQPSVSGTINATLPAMTMSLSGTAEAVVSDGTVEGRLAALERTTQRHHEKQGEQIAQLQRTVDRELAALRDQHREAREESETSDRDAARFSLGGTALFAIVGAALQISAAFV